VQFALILNHLPSTQPVLVHRQKGCARQEIISAIASSWKLPSAAAAQPHVIGERCLMAMGCHIRHFSLPPSPAVPDAASRPGCRWGGYATARAQAARQAAEWLCGLFSMERNINHIAKTVPKKIK